MNISLRPKWGFTLIEIMIVVAIISLLASIAVPNYVKARTTTQRNACVNNLRQIDSAKQQWALEYKKGTDVVPTVSQIREYLKHSLVCPIAGTASDFDSSYVMGTVGEVPTCKIMPNEHTLPLATGGD